MTLGRMSESLRMAILPRFLSISFLYRRLVLCECVRETRCAEGCVGCLLFCFCFGVSIWLIPAENRGFGARGLF